MTAPPKAIKLLDNISPMMVIRSVLIPIDCAILGLSPVAMKACPSSVWRKKISAIVIITMMTNPTNTESKYLGRCRKKAAEKSYFWLSNEILADPIMRKLMDNEAVITKIPANKIGIFPFV